MSDRDNDDVDIGLQEEFVDNNGFSDDNMSVRSHKSDKRDASQTAKREYSQSAKVSQTARDSQSASENKEKGKKRKKKVSKQRRRVQILSSDSSESDRYSSDSSDSSSSSSDSETESKTKKAKKSPYEMFNPYGESKAFALDDNLASFLKEYFSKYLDDETMAKVLENCPVPDHDNLSVPKLDEYWLEIFSPDKRNIPLIKSDKSLVRVQNALMRTMGPLGQMWTKVDKVMKREIPADDLCVEDIIKWIEKTVICIGQINVQLNFFRRLPLIAKITGEVKTAQKLLIDNPEKLDGKKHLLGRKFKKVVHKTIKKHKNNSELRKCLNSAQRGSYRPFRAGPSANGNGSEGKFSFRGENQPRGRGNPSYRRGRASFNPRFRGRYVRTKTKFTWHNNVKVPICTQVESTTAQCSVKSNSTRAHLLLRRNPSRDSPNKVNNLGSQNAEHPSGGKIEAFPRKLEKIDTRPIHLANSIGVEDELDSGSISIKKSLHSKIRGRRMSKNRSRNRENASKEGNRGSKAGNKSVCVPSVSGPQKGRRSKTSYKSEETQSVHKVRTLQNGKHERLDKHDQTGGFHDQIRSQGRLLQRPSPSNGNKIHAIQMETKLVSIPGDGLRPGTSTTNLYQVTQTSSCPSETNGNKGSDLSGRSDNFESRSRQDFTANEIGCIHTRKPGVSLKLGENRSNSMSGNGISRVDHQYSRHDPFITRPESTENNKRGSSDNQTKTGDRQGVIETHRQNDSIHPSSTISAPPLPSLANVEWDSFNEGSKLRNNTHSESRVQGRSDMVDQVLENKQWSNNTSTKAGSPYNNGRERLWLGGLESKLENRGCLEPGRTKMAHQCQRIEGGHDGCQSFCERFDGYPYHSLYGQLNSSCSSKQKIQYGLESFVENNTGTVGVLQPETNVSVSCLHSGEIEYNSRYNFPCMDGFHRLETGSQGIQTNRKQVGGNRNRPVCKSIECPEGSFCKLEAGSLCNSHRCIPTELDEYQGVGIYSVLSNRQNSKKNTGRKSTSSVDHSYMANPNLVPGFITNDNRNSVSPNRTERVTNKSKRGGSSLDNSELTDFSSVESFRQRERQQGFSDEAAQLLSNKWRKGTKASYNYAWAKWSSWARARDIHPFSATVTDVVNFLSEMFKMGYEYSTINGFRSSISALHPPIDKMPVGQHKQVSDVMAGIFNSNPPTPKYASFWDVGKVLDHIKSMGDNDSLEPRDLTWKLSMLLALVTASRSSDLASLDTKFMTDMGDKIVFQVRALEKTRKIGHKPRTVTIFELPEEALLDAVSCLRLYKERTEHLRPKEGNQLLISTVRPYQPVKSCTIAGWIKKLLDKAGIDTSVWTAHSTRGASTSKAISIGVTIQDILDSANWKSAGTFRKFYRKPIEDGKVEFQKKVLTSCK